MKLGKQKGLVSGLQSEALARQIWNISTQFSHWKAGDFVAVNSHAEHIDN